MNCPTQSYWMREQRTNAWKNSRINQIYKLDPYYLRDKSDALKMAVTCFTFALMIAFLTMIGWAVTLDTTPPPVDAYQQYFGGGK